MNIVVGYFRIVVIMILNVFPTIPIEEFVKVVKISKDRP